MARNDLEGDQHGREQSARAAAGRESGPTGRDRHRDNDDVRDPIASDDRMGTAPDTKFEARGDARENAGNHARGSDTDRSGPEGNDRQAARHDRDPRSRSFDEDLQRDDRKARE